MPAVSCSAVPHCSILLLALAGLRLPVSALTQPKLDFNRDVRPILSDKCFLCHGPDDKQRKADLRLDLKESAFKAGKSGALPIVPGNPGKSELVARVTSTDTDDVMPPPKVHKRVSAQELEILKRWIAEGAEYQGHWAFQPVKRPPVPKVEGAGANAIDAFVVSRLAKEGLQASPETDKATLIRRVTLDLTGLPPSSAEVKAFLADSSPKAYEKVVDRLLASPHYGEQMARQWLDFARYADSHGFQTDSSRSMWPWRDWVIHAFNTNMPFDQFTIQQIGGDLLPNATLDHVVATGFNRNHRINGEGGIIAEEWRIENIIDRVETTGFTWLGLTLPRPQVRSFHAEGFLQHVRLLQQHSGKRDHHGCFEPKRRQSGSFHHGTNGGAVGENGAAEGGSGGSGEGGGGSKEGIA